MSSSSKLESATSAVSVPNSHVGLILLREEDSSFYLQIPLDIIGSLCLKPRKYLLFLGWCILGVEGILALEHNGDEIETDGDLDSGEVYYYVADAGTDLTKAVDLEVIKTRTNVSSETTEARDDFRTNLLERDTCCVWTGIGPVFGAGLYIIPYKRGSEWLRLIVKNRPSYDEDVTELDDINDIRNGVFANVLIRDGFDPRCIVILKTPNHILGTKDIPVRHNRSHMPQNVVYPAHSRYTLQWLENLGVQVQSMVPNNSDAAFKKYTRKPKPSELLLHYNYGAAAVKCWGHGMKVLQNHAKPPRPPVPVPAPMGLSRATHDRGFALHKRDTARAADAGNATAGAGAGTGELVESEGQPMWDEDDVMLFFWGNSQAAKKRHLKKVHEDTQRIEQWRDGVPQVSV